MAKKRTRRPPKESGKRCPIVFVSGLPRSGSTLLMNVLAQNPKHYCTPTSGLLGDFENVLLNWSNIVYHKTEGIDVVRPKIRRGLKGLLTEYHGDALDAKKTVFEKNRGWPRHLEQLDGVFGCPVYCILVVRDIRCVCASFEKLHRKPDLAHKYPQLGKPFWEQTSLEGRIRYLMADDGVVGGPVALTLDAIRRLGKEKPARLIKVSYQKFTHDPKGTMNTLHNLLGLPAFNYQFDNIEQKTKEDDMTFFGMELHTVKPKIKPQRKDWDVLTPEICETLNKGNLETLNQLDLDLAPPDDEELEDEELDEEADDELEEDDDGEDSA